MSDVQAKKMWLPEAMGLMQDLRVENEALRARIAELELAIDWLGDDDLKDEVLKSGGNELVFIAMKIVDKLEIGDLQGLVSYAQNVYDIMKARERPRNTEIRRQIGEG